MVKKRTPKTLTLAQKKWISLLLIIVLAFVVRLYHITNPVADWHAFRQADTASVTREYVKHGVDLLRPRYQDLSNIQSGIDNLEGWRMVEFPIINGLLASIIRTAPAFDLVILSRLLSVWASLGTLVSLFFLVKRISGSKAAFFTAIAFAFLPYSVFYSRAILPEPFMLFFSTFSIWTFYEFLHAPDSKRKIRFYLLSLTSLALAFLIKPFVLFLGLIYLVLFLQKEKWNFWKHPEVYLFYPLLALIPIYLWREWILNFPSGIPASDWLFNSRTIDHHGVDTAGIRLKPAWFRWLFYERLTKLILGYIGVVFLAINGASFFKIKNIKNNFSELSVYLAWSVGILLYMIIIATGNVRHDYYQVLATPIICMWVGRGAAIIWEFFSKKNQHRMGAGILTILFALTVLGSWQQVRGYFVINHWEYIQAGKAVDRLTPCCAKVIAPAMGDTIFLFQTNRVGWPIGLEIDDKISKGATHYVSTSYDDEARELEQKYPTIIKTDTYLLLDLTKTLE